MDDDSEISPVLRELAHIPMIAPELAPGTLVADRFAIARMLGRGGFARVYAAWDHVQSRAVALKVPLGEHLELFDHEASALEKLDHPNIVKLYERGTWRGLPFLVLELVDGEPVVGPMSVREAWSIARSLAAALVHAHARGVLHLDLKPANVLRQRNGAIKIVDFGLAGLASRRDLGGGTPGAMAPEQASGDLVDARTDVWGIGMTVRQLVGDSPLPPRAARVLARMLARDPADRYPDALAVHRAVRLRAEMLEPQAATYR